MCGFAVEKIYLTPKFQCVFVLVWKVLCEIGLVGAFEFRN